MLERTDPIGISGTEQTVVGESSAAPDPSDELRPGASLGRYTVLSEAGRGAMGVVYAAYDPQLDRKIALKVLHRADPDAQQRLLREARALASFVHPNVVTVHDVGEARGRAFIATEFIDGGTVKEWLADGERALDEVLEVMRAAGRGLAAAHDAGLVHRDFKPHNIMLARDGRVVVMDFGLARRGAEETELATGVAAALDASPSLGDSHELGHSQSRSGGEDLQLTSPGSLVGTPAYMSLEQHRGQAATPSSDQFSFCVSLFEGLAGHGPFKGQTRTSIAFSIARGRRRAWPAGRSIPSRVRRAVDRGLSARPEDRWPDMASLLDELEPPRSARATPWVVGTAAIALVLGAVGASSLAAKAPGCDAAGIEALERVWPPPRRAAIRAAFSSSSVSYADETARRVLGRLDAYASDWLSGTREACEAHRVARLQTASVHEARVRCLEQGLVELDALATLLERADAATIRQASDAAASLPDLARCSDVDALLEELAPPKDPRVARAVETTRRLLVEARARTTAGDYEGAVEKLDEAAAAAPAGEKVYLPVEAELSLARGTLLVHQGHFDESAAALRQAHLDARRAGHRRVALESALQLTYVVGYRLARYEEAELWGDLAMVEADREGSRSIEHAEVLGRIGIVHGRQGRFETARDHYQRARELYEELGATDDPGYDAIFTNLGLVSLNLGEVEAADHYLSVALERASTRYGDGHPRVANATLNLASAALKKGDAPLALERAQASVTLAESSLGPEHPTVGYAQEALGRAALAVGDLDEAARAMGSAAALLESAQGPEHPALCEVRIRRADIMLLQGELEAARTEATEAHTVLERRFGAADPRTAEASGLLAMIELALGHEDAARGRAHRLLELVAEGSPNSALPRARALLVLARLDTETSVERIDAARAALATTGAEGAHLMREIDPPKRAANEVRREGEGERP